MSSHLSNRDEKARTQHYRAPTQDVGYASPGDEILLIAQEPAFPKSAAGGPRVVKRTYNHRKIKNGFTLYPSNRKQLHFVRNQAEVAEKSENRYAAGTQRQSYDVAEFDLATANRGRVRYENQADKAKQSYLVKMDSSGSSHGGKSPARVHRNRDMPN